MNIQHLILLLLLICCECKSQDQLTQVDTIAIVKRASILLSNVDAFPPFTVSGDIYLTDDAFIFHPFPYRGRRYEMYNHLVKDLSVLYKEIDKSKSVPINGIVIKTKSIRYKIAEVKKKNRRVILAIIESRKR